uniref:RNA-binding protein n=1 Tax=Fundidesulfovibrio putealis TaxID=270496 RepID=A0A7C4EJ15_9BACT
MSKKLYVGNLSFSSTEDDVRNLFSNYGEVFSVALITDRETGRLRGFGFVEMDDAGAQAAIQNIDGKEFGGRTLKVNEAQEKPRTGGYGGGGGRPGGGGGGGRRW